MEEVSQEREGGEAGDGWRGGTGVEEDGQGRLLASHRTSQCYPPPQYRSDVCVYTSCYECVWMRPGYLKYPRSAAKRAQPHSFTAHSREPVPSPPICANYFTSLFFLKIKPWIAMTWMTGNLLRHILYQLFLSLWTLTINLKWTYTQWSLMPVNPTPGCPSLHQSLVNHWEVMRNQAGLMCWRVDMHFNNSDKLDLTANHRQQWARTLRAATRLTLQRGSAMTTARDCVTLCLNSLISVKVWNRSDCKHLFSPAVTCYPFSGGELGECVFPAREQMPAQTRAFTCYTCISRPGTIATKKQDDGIRCIK